MEKLDQIEDELLNIFQKTSVVHEILAFLVNFGCEFYEEYLMHCNFQVPLPGLKVRTDNLVNGAEDIFSKNFICNYEISYPGNLSFVPFPFKTILTNSNLLRQNKTIKILTIGHTVRLNSAGVKEICDALKVNNTIQDLQCNANLSCGGNFYLEMGNVLNINKTIKQLDIFTYKNDEGFQFFADVLKTTETLKSFKFSDPKMTLDVLQELLNSVKINKSITEFCLTSCGITSETCQFVTTALAFDNKIHPILKSRILSVKVLANNYDSIDELLQHYIESNTKKNKIPIDYFYNAF